MKKCAPATSGIHLLNRFVKEALDWVSIVDMDKGLDRLLTDLMPDSTVADERIQTG